MKKILALVLFVLLLSTLLVFCSCEKEEARTVKVMLEDGAHFTVKGDSVKTVTVGENVSFNIEIEEGYYYASNNCGAVYSDGVVTLTDVRTPQTIVLGLFANVYSVKLMSITGMQVEVGNESRDSALVSVEHGGIAEFTISISEEYEFYSVTATGDSGNKIATYANGKVTVENISEDTQVSVQLRAVAVIQDSYTITVKPSDYFTISGSYSQEYYLNDTAEFSITFAEGYFFNGTNCGAVYADGKLSFSPVQANQTIEVYTKREGAKIVSYDGGVVAEIADGTKMTYSATADNDCVFSHWLIDEETYSYANNVTVENTVKLTAVFTLKNNVVQVIYHANGGKVNESTDTTVTYCFQSPAYLYPAALGEWCFKTFSRDGYVPIEYNTEADGSGDAYSLGSKLFINGKVINLYVIWAQENPATDFTYVNITEGTGSEQIIVGIKLTEYLGTNEYVVIPTEINGYPVQTIAENCFHNLGITTLVISENVKNVEARAINNCDSLSTLYMCDSVEEIGNSSFYSCSKLANLRMIAKLPPVYSDHLIGTIIRRFEILYNTQGNSTFNIILYGGSSVFQGFDGATLDAMFSDNFVIMNGGQNAYISGPLMLELYSYFMEDGDLMVFIPEYGGELYETALQLPSWVMLENFYDAFRYIDLRDYSNIFSSFYDLQHGSMFYEYIGKLQQISDAETSGKVLSYEKYNDTVDEYFTRADNFVITKAQMETDPNDYVDHEDLHTKVEDNINEIYNEKYVPRGIKMYFAAGALWNEAFPNCMSQIQEYEEWLKEDGNLDFPYISDYTNHMFAYADITDSVSHLTRDAAVRHSTTLGNELKEQMQRDNYSLD